MTDKPSITLLGEIFPVDPISISMMLEKMNLSVGPVVPTREWRELYSAFNGSVIAALHPFYSASVREFEAAGRPVVGSAPVGVDGTENWLEKIGLVANVDRKKIDEAKNNILPAIKQNLKKDSGFVHEIHKKCNLWEFA